jgi:serine/threonine-protein kinase RsbW
MVAPQNPVRLQFRSHFDMLDFVQVVCDRVAHLAGLDEDSIHWIDVAVRESVINAIKHGNREDLEKSVMVEFLFVPPVAPTELVIRVIDQGPGFEPEEIADPLAPENLLKAAGAGSSSCAASWTIWSSSGRRKAAWKSGW